MYSILRLEPFLRAQNFKYIFYGEGGGGGDQKNDMAGYEDFVYIFGRGKNKIGPVLGGHFYAILGPVQCTTYRIGIAWGLLKVHFYLSIYF